MKRHLCFLTGVLAMWMGWGGVWAADAPAAKPQATSSQASAVPKPAKRKASAPVKLVDINTATPVQLQTLPGITEAEVAKIVASRPFGSKAWLVTQGILSAEQYDVIKHLIIAEQQVKKPAQKEAVSKDKKTKPAN